MTREKAREAAAVMQAFVDGEEVQYSPKQGKGSSFWTTTDNNPLWNWEHYDYRIKPAKTLRPWTKDEVPLGAWIKSKQHGWRALILAVKSDGRIAINDCGFSPQFVLENCEHSLDGGKTWKPCGVEEESK